MTRATAALVSEAEYMVTAFSNEYARRFPGVSKDDLAQEGRRVVLELAQRYDPTRGSAFATYCYYRLHGALLDYAKKELQSPLAVFVSVSESRDEDLDRPEVITLSLEPDSAQHGMRETLQGSIAAFVAAHALAGTAPSPEDVHRNASRGERVRAAVAALPDEEATFVRLFYEDELTLEEVATAMGISKRSAGRTHKRVKQKLTSRLFEAAE